MNDLTYVDSMRALENMCLDLKDKQWLALDTEFIRDKTYYPKLALIQIASTDRVYCVDPLALRSLDSLFELLENEAITKVFHSAAQDLEVIFNRRGRIPTPIFDTQIAAALMGVGEQISYAALVKRLIGIELEKSQTRTNWMKRPLQEKQLDYAADDVRYLAKLYPLTVQELERRGRMDWMREEVSTLIDPESYRSALSACVHRVKGAGKLKRQALNVLMHLSIWRENQAMKRDLPRRWVLRDEVLMDLAIQQPSTFQELESNQLLDRNTADRWGRALLKLIAQAQGEPEETWPDVRYSKKPSAQEDAALDRLWSVVCSKAEALELSPSRIVTRSDLMKFVCGEKDIPLFRGWRLTVAGQEVLNTTIPPGQ